MSSLAAASLSLVILLGVGRLAAQSPATKAPARDWFRTNGDQTEVIFCRSNRDSHIRVDEIDDSHGSAKRAGRYHHG
jgi:hypothetical protein